MRESNYRLVPLESRELMDACAHEAMRLMVALERVDPEVSLRHTSQDVLLKLGALVLATTAMYAATKVDGWQLHPAVSDRGRLRMVTVAVDTQKPLAQEMHLGVYATVWDFMTNEVPESQQQTLSRGLLDWLAEPQTATTGAGMKALTTQALTRLAADDATLTSRIGMVKAGMSVSPEQARETIRASLAATPNLLFRDGPAPDKCEAAAWESGNPLLVASPVPLNQEFRALVEEIVL